MADDDRADPLGRADIGAAATALPQAGDAAVAPDSGPGRLLTVPRPETGDPRVDAALTPLDDLTELSITEHPAVFERVHAQLSEVLGELASGPLAGPHGRDGS